jgi:hypothetical protein
MHYSYQCNKELCITTMFVERSLLFQPQTHQTNFRTGGLAAYAPRVTRHISIAWPCHASPNNLHQPSTYISQVVTSSNVHTFVRIFIRSYCAVFCTVMAPVARPNTLGVLARRALVTVGPAIVQPHIHQLGKRGLSVNHTQGVTLGVIGAYVVIIAILWNVPYIKYVLWPFKVCF